MLSLSTTCNLGCTFCSRKSERPAPERRVLAQALLDGRARGHDQVVLDGAEPLMSAELLWAARAARAAGYATVALETNGIGLDERRIRRLAEAGVTRIMPFLPGWSAEATSSIAREPEAGALVSASAPAVDGSDLELLPVVPVAREVLPHLHHYVDFVRSLYPRARGIALRFFPDAGELAHQTIGEQPLARMVEAADAAGFRVYPAGSPVVPPCAFDELSSLRDLVVLDGTVADDVARIRQCETCVLAPRCPGVSASFLETFPRARLAPVRTLLPR
jgi:pyruvate-formate lyase-activating enzyme